MLRPLVEITDLVVQFRTAEATVEAVRGASLTIAAGETVAIVGESGSGKSTLTSALNRLLPANGAVTSGAITFEDRDLLALSEREMSAVRGRLIGLVPQDPMSNLNPLMRVGKQVAEVFKIHGVATGKDARNRAIELLDMVGIPEPARRFSAYPHELSGGMRQRVLIAMGLACRPRLLIADEPTSALDVTVQKVILDQLAALTESMGTAVLLVTHDLALAAERADHIVVMNQGVVVETGPAREILSCPADDYTKRLIAAAPTLGAKSMVGGFDEDRAADGAPVIDVVDLTKTYPVRSGVLRSTPFTAVDDITITIPRGTTVGIVGESGSGKSTTAKMVLKLESPSSGHIRFEGNDIADISGKSLKSFRRRVQPVFQNPYASLDPLYTVGDAIREPLDVHGVGTPRERERRVVELLTHVSLDPQLAGRHPHELSGGQRQRVAIARALALDPEVVVLDEAVSALDVVVQAQILELLVSLQQRLGLTYLFISHDLAVVRMICHSVYVMKSGKVVESGTPAEIFHKPQHEYTKTLLAAIPDGEGTVGKVVNPA
ncbi:ABC transporter ATP-binding protein [Mycolicibacterium smegmatis]|uniref:ABC transporter ATP-binding protein n=1 Tax=Mycolicibacterium smegmatis TaxID=1772 RepID=UPI001E282BCB|nr:ABC transporter ATP-binding protein [Mycolicibacterium smegmatis]UGU33121.1 ABC transporter ATP-binding protein [Mycolicibacterium smegmatis]ULN68000.1 ABC transporter ATP-binding protein [Mycolicibacterium smegmatis]